MKNKKIFNDEIVILQQVVPAYRVNFFRELSSRLKFELYVSNKGLAKRNSISIKDKNYKINFINSLNFFNIFLFQFLPFKKLFLKNIIIYEFNIRIISSLFLLFLRIITNKKNILWTHGLTDNMSFLSKKIRIFFMKRVNCLIVYESGAKKRLIKLGILEKNITNP